MAKKPQLSVILVFRNQRDAIESVLTSLYELQQIELELAIIDDASSDDSVEVIHSILDHYQHRDTYFFEHTSPVGRGNALNEALAEITGRFLWIPQDIAAIKEEQLLEHINTMSQDDPHALLQHNSELPDYGDIESWIRLLDQDQLPEDELFLWNWQNIPAHQRFFNPYLSRYHACELAMRTLDHDHTRLIDPFFERQEPLIAYQPDYSMLSEFVFTLLRRTSLKSQQKELLLQLLNPAIPEPIETRLGEDEDDKLEKALTFYKAGNTAAALDLTNQILEENEQNIEAKKLKVQVLEKLRRYVEAAELKHSIRMQSKEEQAAQISQDADEAPADQTEEAEEPEQETTSSEPAWSPEPSGNVPEEPYEHTEEEEQAGVNETGGEESGDEQDPGTEHIQPDIFSNEEIVTSIIIATTADCKPLLEHSLLSLDAVTQPNQRELIVVDNASLDDTHAYVQQLEENEFFGIKTVVNSANPGFARSINDALDKANGTYALILHNDVELQDGQLEALEKAMEANPGLGLLGALSERTPNPDQDANRLTEEEAVQEVEFIDSFCMMYRTSLGLRFDEQFSPAFFDDVDFAFQVRNAGYEVGVATHVLLKHLYAETTSALNLYPNGRLYWRNANRFNEKWQLVNNFPQDYEEADPLEQLLVIGKIANPYYPEPHLQERFEGLMTEELRTRIRHNKHEAEVLEPLIDVMMIMDQRDILRRLEDQLEEMEPSVYIIRRLVDYYFYKNIFSRCKHYISMLEGNQRELYFDLMDLHIKVQEKEIDTSIEKLNELMNRVPFNADLYKLAGDIHSFEGNRDEANQFYELVHQARPDSLVNKR